MNKDKHQEPAIVKKKRRGQRLLFLAAVLNGAVFFLGLFLASLQGELDGKVTDEMYFMRNDQAISAEISKRTLLHTSLNQLKLLRRIARERISLAENKMLLIDESVFQREINASLRKIGGAAFLQAHDPPAGHTPDEIFSKMSDDEVASQLPTFQDQGFQFAKGIKADMNSLRSRIAYWKVINSTLLTISTMVLIIGSYLVYDAEGISLGKK
jgi:hypothetical protein